MLNDFLNNVTNGIIEAVRLGGYTSVYILDNLDIIVTNVSVEEIIKGGHNIAYTIECKSYGDLGYQNEEDFAEADSEYCYLDNIQEELEDIYLRYSKEELYGLVTIQEASKLYKREESTLRRVLQGPQFTEGLDYRKAGKVWLINKKALERVYGGK